MYRTTAMSCDEIKIARGSHRDPLSRIGRAAALWLRRVPVDIRLRNAVVSFSFDDVPDTAVSNGARILEDAGGRGTFYLSGKLAGASFCPWRFFREEDVLPLHEAGHEIGCHTYSHAIVQTLDAAQLEREFDDNRAWLRGIDPRLDPVSFAYPYGAIGYARKGQAAGRFASCRGVRHGLNVGAADRAQLKAVQLYDRTIDETALRSLIDQAVRQKAWLIFYTHDVQNNPTEHGCSPRLLRRAAELSLAAGAEILTVKEGYSKAASARAVEARSPQGGIFSGASINF